MAAPTRAYRASAGLSGARLRSGERDRRQRRLEQQPLARVRDEPRLGREGANERPLERGPVGIQDNFATAAGGVTTWQGIAQGDLNGDGATDIALTDNVGVKVLMHTGAASSTTFAAPLTVFTQSPNANVVGGNVIAIGDVDGDGLNDLVITDPGPTGGMATAVYVLIQDPANHGTFLTSVGSAIATQDRPQSIALRDLMGTGKPDIVIGGQKFVTVLLHDPANPGKFLPATVYSAPGANEIAIADINGDGKLDIVVSNGVTFPMQGGVSSTHPGVLLQSTTTPGAFGALQDLP